MKKILFLCLVSMLLFSCISDDDVCLSGEATPRMKVKLRDKNNRAYTIPQIFVDVDYGNGLTQVISATSVDSVLIPLRVDNVTSTKMRIRTSTTDTIGSVVQMDYTTKSEYVSPACGMKRLYQNLSGNLLSGTILETIQQQQNEILDENHTHYYFIFSSVQ